MKRMIAATAFLAASTFAVYAQTPTPSPEAETPAVATPDTTNPTAPVAGANSFTEEQARARLQEGGYTAVSGLKLDDKGIWQATATKDGKPVNVALDYQGNIVAN
ncbi:PepSY domain-containing protein [Ensifer sp.]|uniref:PepSY domain-containing protein n=1 Tax=Ensifer sp. TaxID=1872086 RepID=UPI000DD9D800|nr:PepSY domain-containing protein [Ensifer sp.]